MRQARSYGRLSPIGLVLLSITLGCANVDYATVAGPTELGCGGYNRVINWSLSAPAPGPGWVVQKMVWDINWLNCDRSPREVAVYTYWEAWPVHAAGDMSPRPRRDTWNEPNHGPSMGGWKVVGEARFFPGVALPPGMIPNNPATPFAGVLPATTVQPPWWGGTMLAREVAYEWDCCDFNVSDRIIDTHDR